MRTLKRAVKAFLLLPGIRRAAEASVMAYYAGRNSRSRRLARKRTPWACEWPDFDPDRSLAYLDGTVSDYLLHSGHSREAFAGKRILEIGPGENLGVALDFLLGGAARVVCVDRFHSLRPAADQEALYRRMRARLDAESGARFDGLVRLGPGGPEFDPQRLRYISDTPLELLDGVIGGERFDYILSRAVLEHLYDLDAAMDVMHRLLIPGGTLIHEVDFRDHGMFTRLGLNPLTLLTVPDGIWRRMTSDLGAPNRCLVDYFERRLDGLGYARNILVKFVVGAGEREFNKPTLVRGQDFGEANLRILEAIRPRLLPRYRSLSDEKLLASAIFFTARKPG